MSDLDDFIREHNLMPEKSRKSALTPYADEIFKMKEMGFTEKIILQFLKEKKGISVSQQTLNWFIRSRKNVEPTPATNHKTIKTAPIETGKSKVRTQPTNQIDPGKPRKFQWGNTPPDEELFGSHGKNAAAEKN